MPIKNYIRKIIASLFLISFLNLGFLIIAREVYSKPNELLILIIFNIILCIDINIRPISPEKDHFKYPKLSIFLFLLLPFVVIFPYLENFVFIRQFFRFWNNYLIFLCGFIILISGGIILLYSRILLGKFGSSKITVEQNHRLIHKGLYKYVRHPIYLEMILVFFGYALSFKSIIIPLVFFFSFFFLFKNRMDLEEKMRKERFGKIYELYMAKTKRLIPFIY